ncbi:MAG: hypothetical protein LBS23_01595 [Holosporaceae bacterium]|jgi:hypothetical protein|nr:hypothetical protein [Holosporaceae bacterium]
MGIMNNIKAIAICCFAVIVWTGWGMQTPVENSVKDDIVRCQIPVKCKLLSPRRKLLFADFAPSLTAGGKVFLGENYYCSLPLVISQSKHLFIFDQFNLSKRAKKKPVELFVLYNGRSNKYVTCSAFLRSSSCIENDLKALASNLDLSNVTAFVTSTPQNLIIRLNIGILTPMPAWARFWGGGYVEYSCKELRFIFLVNYKSHLCFSLVGPSQWDPEKGNWCNEFKNLWNI